MEFHGVEKLRGAENWNVWKFMVRNLLRGSEGAYEVCINSITKPDPLENGATSAQVATYNLKLKEWDKADRSASQIIVKTLEANIMALLVACETARDMWVKLHAIFEQQTKQAAHAVQTEFFSFNMNLADDMVTHIAKFEGLVLRMRQLNVKPDDSALMVKFLDTLPDSYESFRQAWWARPEEQQTLDKLMAVLTSDEKRRQQRSFAQDTLCALVAAKPKGDYSKQVKGSSKLPNQKGQKSCFKCFSCGLKGHMRRDCPNPKKRKEFKSDQCTPGSVSSNQAFISECLNAEFDTNAWIVDSGATDHITHHGEWFSTFSTFPAPVEVHVGNNSTMNAIGRGRIDFRALINGE